MPGRAGTPADVRVDPRARALACLFVRVPVLAAQVSEKEGRA